MKSRSRIASILTADCLDFAITGFQTFSLSKLRLETVPEFQLPTNLRLGHLAEKIVSELIKSSSNYKVLYENVQFVEGNRTVGEIDFIIEKVDTKELIHMELAYKFYLYDPSISSEQVNNWIGPNRNDSLKEKLGKLKRKQFPLLNHACAKASLENVEIEEVSQSLCLLVSLFVPYECKVSFSEVYAKAIKGYYLNFETFVGLNKPSKTYYIPVKTEWGIDPSEHDVWSDFEVVEKDIRRSMDEAQAVLCWQKSEDVYTQFFVIWW